MSIMDGITINSLHSFVDFGLCIKSRNIGLPDKKSIRQTVPFMNGYYDFTALNGAPAWNERIIEFAFDVLEDTPQELETTVETVLDWLCNAHDVDIADDALTGYHWHGSYESCNLEYDESGLKAEIQVSFVVHPFKISDQLTEHTLQAGTHVIINDGMNVAPYATSDATNAIQIGNYVSSITANETIQLNIDLARGTNTIIITGSGTVTLMYYKEVL